MLYHVPGEVKPYRGVANTQSPRHHNTTALQPHPPDEGGSTAARERRPRTPHRGALEP